MATKVYKPKRKISATESEEIKIPASSVDGLSTVATSGSYNDLSNKPTIPDVSGLMPKSGGTFTGNISVPSTITFTDTTNPYIKMTTGGTAFYFQSTSGQFGLGPTWNKATHWDANGNVTFPTAPKVGSSSLALKSDIPTNYVTTNTAQDITAEKKFLNTLIVGAKDDGSTGFKVIQGDIAGGDTLFTVSVNGIDLDAHEHNIPLLIGGNAGTSGQVLTSQGAGNAPIWTIPTKGTVTQVKINGTTKSPNSAGLVDLGTISGGVQVLTANEVNISSLSNGVYLWKFTVGYSSFTLSGIGDTGSPQKFTFTPESYAKLATLEVSHQSTAYINFTLSYDVSNPISNGGKKTITYMYGVGKIEEYSNWVEAVDVSGSTGGALSVIGMTTKTADLKVTLLPDATTEGETTDVTVSVGGYSSTNIKNIIKSSDKFPMNLVFEKTRAGLLISETALDGKFDSFGNSNDSGIYDDEIYLAVKYTSDRSSITTDYMLNGTLISSITYS